MNIKKDRALQQFFQQTPAVKPSENFTAHVMTQLPARHPSKRWGIAFLALLWIGFITWIWVWQAELIGVWFQLGFNMRALQLESFIPYLVFLAGLGILLWQTGDFLTKNFSCVNKVKNC